MKQHLLTVAISLLAATFAFAQEVPYDGIVIEDNVQARASANRRAYVVGEVAKGQKVRVDEVFYGWYKIVSPPGIFSYISKAFVDAKGDGNLGIVSSDGQDVKAASVNGESYHTQTILNKGDTVEIIGEKDSFYKIVPPKGAYVFLPPGSVKRSDLIPPPPPPEVEAPEVEAPEVEAPVEPVVVESDPPPEVAPAPEVEVKAEVVPEAELLLEGGKGESAPLVISNGSLTELEKQMLPLFTMPVEEQPIDQMIAAYEGIDREELTADERLLVRQRIAILKRNQKLAETIRQINAVQEEVDTHASDQEDGSEDHESVAAEYDVIGTLRSSGVYSGETLPRLYRVVSGNGRTLGWVMPAPPVDARTHLGQLVGIVGEKQYDDALKLNLFAVERIDLLEASE